jgi:hypothetical protein
LRLPIQVIEANTDISLLGKPSEESKEYYSNVGIRSESSGRVNTLESEVADNVCGIYVSTQKPFTLKI